MNRREAVQLTATMMGITLLGSEGILSGCRQGAVRTDLFSDLDLALMEEIGDTILPDSDRSPGAKAAGVGSVMKVVVTDCFTGSEQTLFKSGLDDIAKRSIQQFGRDFSLITPAQRFELLSAIDAESRAATSAGKLHYFAMMKQLTIWAYFTSETGQTKALRYDPIPGGFQGNVDYKSGDRAWVGPLCSID